MRAVVVDRFGGPEVLHVAELPEPRPAADEVVIRVSAVTVNRTLDLAVRRGDRGGTTPLPHVLGVDPAGVVVEVGAAVTTLTPGDRVAVTATMWCGRCEACRAGAPDDCAGARHIGVHRPGGYAELVAVPAANAHLLPDGLSFAEAAVILRHAPVAVNLLDRAGLTAGETVLVMGAAGGLGSTCVQAARARGATVIAGAGAPDRVAAAMGLGADHGIDYRSTALAEAIADLTDGRGVDVVVENVGDPVLWPEVMSSLARRGRLVTAGAHAGGRVELDLHQIYRRRLRLIGGGGHTPDDVRAALELAARGAVRGLIGRELPLDRAAEAHQLAESGVVAGKIVLRPTEEERDER